MPFIKISGLTTATAVSATNQFEINQNSTSRSATVAQVAAFARGTATDTVVLPAGTVSAPGLTFTGDTNTGIYSPAADTIAFTEGGVEAMRIDSNANVGIGTTTPTATLDVNGNVAITGTARRITGDFSNATIANRVAFQTSTANASTSLSVIPNGTNTQSDFFAFNSSDPNNASAMVLRVGTIEASVRSGALGTGTLLPMAFHTGASERMRIDTSGNVGIGTSAPAERLQVNAQDGVRLGASGAVSFVRIGSAVNGESTGQISYDRSTGGTIFSQGNTGSAPNERMRIDASGNVGIGTSAPGNKLDIVSAGSSQIRVKDGVNAAAYYDFGRDGTDGFFGFSGAQTAFSGYKWSVNAGTEVMRITNAGNVGIGTSSPNATLHLYNATNPVLRIAAGADAGLFVDYISGFGANINVASNFPLIFGTNNAERARISSDGSFIVGKTSANFALEGAYILSSGVGIFTAKSDRPLGVNRLTSDGTLVSFWQDGTEEGNISVSGTTVSYNGGHLARWSQLPTNQRDPALLKGTVLSNLDEMCEWLDAEGNPLPNEQLNRMKISDVEGDPNVAGVFVNWDNDDQANPYDMNIAMTGDMIIRIAQGIAVQKGMLLISAGDGTAKPQGDDIVRSKTIAKVTSNHVTCTYPDGSYCVPCVLMAC